LPAERTGLIVLQRAGAGFPQKQADGISRLPSFIFVAGTDDPGYKLSKDVEGECGAAPGPAADPDEYF
jgi:hypothetical protein